MEVQVMLATLTNYQTKQRKNLFYSFAALLLTIVFMLSTTISAAGWQQEKLEYDVSVSAQTVPVFAVNKKGQPVFDLKKEDIQFYVGGKAVDFQLFSYRFNGDPDQQQEAPVEIQSPDKPRTIFVLVDTVFNDHLGLKRSKRILKQLIQKNFPNDIFVIVENTFSKGLKFVVGPEKDRSVLLDRIDNKLRSIPDNPSASPTSEGFVASFSVHEQKLRYQQMMRNWNRVLFQFKHLLKVVRGTKMVFLLSSGVPEFAFRQKAWTPLRPGSRRVTNPHVSSAHTGYIKPFAQAINAGGSVLYTVSTAHPSTSPTGEQPGDMSMQFLANESGGKFFKGSDPNIISQDIRSTTAAYYEIAFMTKAAPGAKQKIKIRSKRPGISFHNVKITEKGKQYAHFSEIEKKLFAYNVITRGTWSQLLGTSEKVKGYRLDQIKRKKKTLVPFEIPVPEQMKNRDIDIVTLSVNPETDVVDARLISRKVKAMERVEVLLRVNKENRDEVLEKRRNYVVLIDPETTYSFYIDENPADSVSGKRLAGIGKGIGADSELAIGKERELVYLPEVSEVKELKHGPLPDFKELSAALPGQELLPGIMEKVSAYCERLERESFHFFCYEQVYEAFQKEEITSRRSITYTDNTPPPTAGQTRAPRRSSTGRRTSTTLKKNVTSDKRYFTSRYQVFSGSEGFEGKTRTQSFQRRKTTLRESHAKGAVHCLFI